MTVLDPAAFREALRKLPTCVTVVTTRDADGRPHGITIGSFSSVSLQPPLVLWTLQRAAWSHRLYVSAQHFAVNVLSADQAGLSSRFASRVAERFDDVLVDTGLFGLPLIRDCLATLECAATNSHDAGDHTIFVGEVLRHRTQDRAPLVHCGGAYHTLEVVQA